MRAKGGFGPLRTGRALAVLVAALALSQAALPLRPAAAASQATSPAASPADSPGAPDVATVARTNGKSVADVARILADPTARVDKASRIYFVEPPPATPESSTTPASSATPDTAPFPYADTFLLHSRPGSQRTIYLDFDGETISGTAWNGNFGAPTGPFYAEPFSTDASAAFSTSEQDIVQSVWQRVAEDYAPFDIDVTTQDPGPAAITRSGAGDLIYGTRALITDAPEVGDTCGCGGVAYIGTFDEPSSHAYYQPAWIVAQNLSHNSKYIAEATSHEVGHNLGLSHDGTSTQGYYGGHGAWAPIMGEGYSDPIVQFSKGGYPDSNNPELDFDVIAANGGPLRGDDHGDTTATATGLGLGPSLGASGVITTDADVDAFRVEAAAGAATFAAAPAPTSPNLDILLEVRDAAGALLVSDDPISAQSTYDVASGLSASISTTLPAAGTYYLLVSGVGSGTLATGYSGYGSLGSYSLTGTIGAGTRTVSVSDATPVAEGPTGGGGTASFTVTLSSAAPAPVTVVATTANGTATAGSDYTAASSTVTFAPGVTSVPFAVTITGDGIPEPTETFLVDLTSPSGATLVDAQGVGTIANDDIASLRSWGFNDFGQVGDGSVVSRRVPTPLSLSQVDAVAAGGFHSLALKGGTVWSWGLGHVGQLGQGTTSSSSVPGPVGGGLSGVTAVSAGVFHSLALKSDGTVWAWGWNAYGQLGDGTTVDRSLPVRVVGLTGVVAIAAGGLHNLALKSDGTVWAWGYNGVGQLGVATPAQSPTAAAVPGLTGVTAIGAGAYHSLAVRAGGTVATWGWNPWGQLGDGTTTSRSTPVNVPGLTGMVAVVGGTGHSLALGADGLVRSWGLGASGQLGRPVVDHSATPAVVPGLTGVTKVVAGGYHSLALTTPAGIVSAWGWNIFGQLGDGTTLDRLSAVPVGLAGVFSMSAGVAHNLTVAT